MSRCYLFLRGEFGSGLGHWGIFRIMPLGVWVINYCRLYMVGHGLDQSLDLESKKHIIEMLAKIKPTFGVSNLFITNET